MLTTGQPWSGAARMAFRVGDVALADIHLSCTWKTSCIACVALMPLAAFDGSAWFQVWRWNASPLVWQVWDLQQSIFAYHAQKRAGAFQAFIDCICLLLFVWLTADLDANPSLASTPRIWMISSLFSAFPSPSLFSFAASCKKWTCCVHLLHLRFGIFPKKRRRLIPDWKRKILQKGPWRKITTGELLLTFLCSLGYFVEKLDDTCPATRQTKKFSATKGLICEIFVLLHHLEGCGKDGKNPQKTNKISCIVLRRKPSVLFSQN